MSGPGMNQVLAEVFGNTKTASATDEDQEKRAQLEFFGELCKEQQIDVTKLAEPQLQELWNAAMDIRKEAEFPPAAAAAGGESDEDKKKKEEEAKAKEKKAAASAEFNQKKEAAAKIAEADYMGRIMAHSLVDEMRKIAADMEGGKPPFPPKKEGKKDEDEKEESEKKAAADRAAALVNALQQRKTASATPAAEGTSSSSTPNFDELAANRAIEMLKSAGVDAELAFAKVNAVYVLGLQDSTKIASAPNEETAQTMRALEFCEAAGFPVDWSKA